MGASASTTAGLILAGGRSQRMGRDKATLDWHGRSLLAHIANQLAPRLNPLVVAVRHEQQLPALPVGTTICYDSAPFLGPLLALGDASASLPLTGAVFLTGCDYPFVTPAVVDFLEGRLDEYDAVVPQVRQQSHPLLALYQLPLATTVERVISQGQRSLHALLDALNVRWVRDEEWLAFDPGARILTNLNTLEDYEDALPA